VKFQFPVVRRTVPVFYAFDLLFLNDADLRRRTLIQRKERLLGLIKRSAVRQVEHFDGQDGERFFDVCCRRDLEGVVAKRRDSTCLDGDHKSHGARSKTATTLSQTAGKSCSTVVLENGRNLK